MPKRDVYVRFGGLSGLGASDRLMSGSDPHRTRAPGIHRAGGLRIRAGRSLWLDAGEPDHLAPFFGFVGDQLTERGRRTRQRYVAEVGETGLQLGIGKPRVDRLVENLDNL